MQSCKGSVLPGREVHAAGQRQRRQAGCLGRRRQSRHPLHAFDDVRQLVEVIIALAALQDAAQARVAVLGVNAARHADNLRGAPERGVAANLLCQQLAQRSDPLNLFARL